MAVKRMDNVGIVVDDSRRRLISFASSASNSREGPRSKANGPGVSPDCQSRRNQSAVSLLFSEQRLKASLLERFLRARRDAIGPATQLRQRDRVLCCRLAHFD